jgi:hypothetical protein
MSLDTERYQSIVDSGRRLTTQASWRKDINMDTRNRLLQVLRGPEAARIRFTFPFSGGTCTIAPQSFQFVANAIDRGTVRLDITHDFPDGVAGQYVAGPPKVLRIQPILGRVEEGLIMHECTHALFDLTRTAVTANQDEAASYVVDALYFRMTGLQRPRWNAEPHATAGGVADDLLHDYAVGTRGIPPLDVHDWNVLCLRVMLHPVYIDGPAGVLGTLFGQQYPHNGS